MLKLIKNSLLLPFGTGLSCGFLSLVFFALLPTENNSSWIVISLITIMEELVKILVVFSFFLIFKTNNSNNSSFFSIWSGFSFGSGFFSFEILCFSLNKENTDWSNAPLVAFVHIFSGIMIFKAFLLFQNQKKILAIFLIFFAIIFHLCYNWIVFNYLAS